MLARVLELDGYSVTQAGTWEQAVAEFRAESADLMMVDLKTSDAEEWPTLEFMRRVQSRVPVVALTAWPNQSASSFPHPIDALLEKPLDLALLLKTIERLLLAAQPQHAQGLVGVD